VVHFGGDGLVQGDEREWRFVVVHIRLMGIGRITAKRVTT
jgi:hypothetical protein